MSLDTTEVVVELLGVETNTLIACLAKEEYGLVYDLIARIRDRGIAEIAAAKPAEPNTHPIKYNLFGKDIQIIVKTLNKHPFDQIYQLAENIRNQALPQLEAASNPNEGKD